MVKSLNMQFEAISPAVADIIAQSLHLSAFDFLNRSSKLLLSSVDETDEDDSMLAAVVSFIVLIKCLLILADVQLSASVEFLRLFMLEEAAAGVVVVVDPEAMVVLPSRAAE